MNNIKKDLEGKYLLKAIRSHIQTRSDLMIGDLKDRVLTSEDLMLDMLENDLHSEVTIYRNNNFCLEYDKITGLKLQTTYSNQEITLEWTNKLNTLVLVKEDIELRKKNGEFKKLAEEEFNISNLVEKAIEKTIVEVEKEIVVEEEIENFFTEKNEVVEKIKSKVKFPNYKKIFNNNRRARRIYFEEMKNGEYKLGNTIYSNNEEMIEIFIDTNTSSNSNFVFEDKEKEIYILVKNNGDYTFKILGKLEDDKETINEKY